MKADEYRKRLLAKLHILLHQCGAYDNREAIYAEYGVDSAADLKEYEIVDIINRLQVPVGSPDTSRRRTTIDATPEVRRMRSEVLALLTKPKGKGMEMPNDFDHINPVVRRLNEGRSLPQLSIEELKNFKAQLYSIRDSGYVYDIARRKFVKYVAQAPVATPQRPDVYVVVPAVDDGPVS